MLNEKILKDCQITNHFKLTVFSMVLVMCFYVFWWYLVFIYIFGNFRFINFFCKKLVLKIFTPWILLNRQILQIRPISENLPRRQLERSAQDCAKRHFYKYLPGREMTANA